MKYCFTLFALILHFALAAQNDFSGKWVGYLTQEKGGFREKYYCTMVLEQNGKKVTGYSYVSVEDIHAEMELSGDISGNTLKFKEFRLVQYSKLDNMVWCLKWGNVQLKKKDSEWTLEGNWDGKSLYGPCIPGKVFLKREVPKA